MKAINKPVEMISWSSADGEVKPIKFKIEDDDGVKTIKVGQIIRVDKIKLSGKTVLCYTCTSTVDDIERLYELRFFPETMQWVIYKI